MIYDIGFYMEHMLYSYIYIYQPIAKVVAPYCRQHPCKQESNWIRLPVLIKKKTIYATDMAPRLPLWELRKLTRCQLLNWKFAGYINLFLYISCKTSSRKHNSTFYCQIWTTKFHPYILPFSYGTMPSRLMTLRLLHAIQVSGARLLPPRQRQSKALQWTRSSVRQMCMGEGGINYDKAACTSWASMYYTHTIYIHI